MEVTIDSASVSTIGNQSNVLTPVLTSVSNSVQVLKTLENGQWKSWTKGTDDAFQGFTGFAPGRGYVCVTDGAGTITFPDNELDYNNVDISLGLNFLVPPKNTPNFGGMFPRAKVAFAKSIQSGQWKSWTKGTDDAFQGFTSTENKNGYVVDVEEVYDTLIETNSSEGGVELLVQMYSNSMVNGNTSDGISYTDPYNAGEFQYNPKQVDKSIPALVMFAQAGSKMFKLDFASEYNGEHMVVYDGSYYYTGTFSENNNSSAPVQLVQTSGQGGGDFNIAYDTKVFNSTLDKKVMNVKIGSNMCVIKYPPVYAESDFIIMMGLVEYYEGNFQESEINTPVNFGG